MHAGPGNSNTNFSSEVHWRTLKEGVLVSNGADEVSAEVCRGD